MDFYGNGHDELHGGFNFVFLNAALEAAAMRAVVEEVEATLPLGAWPIWTGSNHDVSRLATRWAGGDPAKVRCALLILLTLRGTPFLYQGDEIGLTDGPIEQSDLRDAVGIRFWPYYKGRDAERTPMPWSAGPGGGFTRAGVRTWLPMADPAQCNVADQEGDPDSVLAFTRRAIARRAAQRRPGRRPLPLLALPPGTWAFERGGGTVVALNMSDSPQELDGVAGSIVLATDRAGRDPPWGRPDAGGLERGRRRAVTPRRFLLCATPAQGHAVPLLAIAGRLVADGHQVVFFTTEHYRDRVTATGASSSRWRPSATPTI